MKAVVVYEAGGAEKLVYQEVDKPYNILKNWLRRKISYCWKVIVH